MSIPAGLLDRSITLEQATERRDSRGGVTLTWDPTATVWASAKPVPANEGYSSEQLREVQMIDFTLRRLDVTTAWRVLYKNQAFDILSVVEIGRGEGLTLRCVHGLRA